MTVKRAATCQIESAEANAASARADVLSTLQEIRHRIDPRVIVAETAERNLTRLSTLLGGAQATVRARPWLILTSATLIGIAIAARARLLAESEDDEETEPRTDG